MATKLIVPGLNASVTRPNLERSQQLYNSLPEDRSSELAAENIKPLIDLVSQHKLLDFFGLHFVHRHDPLPPGSVKFGVNGARPVYRTTKATDIDGLTNRPKRGYIFVAEDSGLHPYEYQDGNPPEFPSEGLDAFLKSFVEYVTENGLEKVIGLQLYSPNDVRAEAWEVHKEGESVMMDAGEARIQGYKRGQTTGWIGKQSGGKVEISGAQVHVVQDGKKVCYRDGEQL